MRKCALLTSLVVLMVSSWSAASDYVYAISAGEYRVQDIEVGVAAEFGIDAGMADWSDMKSDHDADVRDWADLIGYGYGLEAFVSREGNDSYGNEQYYVARYDGNFPGGFVSYDSLSGSIVSLSSGLENGKVLVQIAKADAVGVCKKLLMRGKLSALKNVNVILDQLLMEPEYALDREALFLHSLSRVAMLVIRDEGGTDGSVFELMRAYGVEITGDSYMPMMLETIAPVDVNGEYHIPETAPWIEEILEVIRPNAAAEVASILEEIDLITETGGDKFRMYFYPIETGMNRAVEVDYSEVMLVKGMLYLAKAMLEIESAYDLNCGEEQDLLTLFYTGKPNINKEMLEKYPDLLKVLPTATETTVDGAAILLQAKVDFINWLDYMASFIDYIGNEEDDQSDDLIFLSDSEYGPKLVAGINEVVDSLVGDSVLEYDVLERYEYKLEKSGEEAGELEIEFVLGEAIGGAHITIQKGEYTYYCEEDYSDLDDDGNLFIYFEAYRAYSEEEGWMGRDDLWTSGLYFEGKLSGDFESITDIRVRFEEDYWEMGAAIFGYAASSVGYEVEKFELDLNPIFGGTARYPDPVVLRDLLPEFDRFSMPIAGTMAKGLMDAGASPDEAATLGGIFPQATQEHWSGMGMAADGEFVIKDVEWDMLIYPEWLYEDAYVWGWSDEYAIYTNYSVRNNFVSLQDKLVDSVYLAKDEYGNTYGSVIFDHEQDYSSDWHVLRAVLAFSKYPHYVTEGDIRIKLYAQPDYGDTYMEVCVYVVDDWGDYWEYIYEGSARMLTPYSIDFRISDYDFYYDEYEFDLSGKYFSGSARYVNDGWCRTVSEQHLNSMVRVVDEPGSEISLYAISGVVNYDNYEEGPIYVQACADDGFIVAQAILEGPGAFVLEGVDAGFDGYVKAIATNTVMLLQNIQYEEHEFDVVEASVDVSLAGADLSGVVVDILAGNTVWDNATWISVDEEVTYEREGREFYRFVAPETKVYEVLFDDYDCMDFEIYNAATMAESYRYSYSELYAVAGQEYLVKIENECDWYDDTMTFTISSREVNDVTPILLDTPLVADFSDSRTNWFSFVPGDDGVYELIGTVTAGTCYSAYYQVYDAETMMRISRRQSGRTGGFAGVAGKECLISVYTYCGVSSGMQLSVEMGRTGDLISNDLAENAELIEINTAVEGTFDGVTGGVINSWGDSKDLWYVFTPEVTGKYILHNLGYSDFSIVVFKGGLFGNIIADIDDTDRELEIYAEAGVEYLIRLGSWYSSSRSFALLISSLMLPPVVANDYVVDAIEMSAGVMVIGTTTGSTGNDMTDRICGDDLDVWYKFRPEKTGGYKVYISATDSDEDAPRFAIFDNTVDEQMAYRPCYENDSFYGYEDALYYIRVAWSDYQTGNFWMFVDYEGDGPANDDWLGAEDIMPMQVVSGSTEGATGYDMTSRACGDIYDVWYKYRSEVNGDCWISIASDEHNPRFAVYQNLWANIENGPNTGVVEWRPCNGESQYLEVKKDNTYYIRVAMTDGDAGDFELQLRGSAWGVYGDTNFDGRVDIADIAVFAEYWMSEEYEYDDDDLGFDSVDVNFDSIVDITDFAVISSMWME